MPPGRHQHGRPATASRSPRSSLNDEDLAGIHFTGSTPVFKHLWAEVGANLDRYRTYPRLVGETGGKDFILAHPSADPAVLRTAMIRGAFEFQGQKCSAASRAYVPASIWKQIKGDLVEITDGLPQGDVTDLSNFMGAVIDDRAFAKHKDAIDRAHATSGIEVVAGGTLRRLGRLLRATDGPRDQGRHRRVVPHRVLRPDPVGARLPRRRSTTGCSTRWRASRPSH